MIEDSENKRVGKIEKKFKFDWDPSFLLVVALTLGLLGGLIGGLAFSRITNDRPGNLGLLPNKTENVKVEIVSGVTDVVEKVTPAVVSISTEVVTRGFWGPNMSTSSGTGFIISDDGLVVTNKHVVGNAKNLTVFTNEGKEYKAEVKAIDPLNDVAFIKLEQAEGLPIVELGDSNNLKVGEPVIAIGNALGQYQNTVTTGIISAIGRALPVRDNESGASSTLDNVLQTDAAINPGNSGGPLVNIRGHVIGINTAIDQGGQNIGFAIPVNVAKTALISLEKHGKIIRPIMGISYIPITKELAGKNNLPVNEGALIYSGLAGQPAVRDGLPASKAGLRENDIITKVDGKKVDSKNSIYSIIQDYAVGDMIELTVIRDQKELKIKLILGEV
jgi:serine protease Do